MGIIIEGIADLLTYGWKKFVKVLDDPDIDCSDHPIIGLKDTYCYFMMLNIQGSNWTLIGLIWYRLQAIIQNPNYLKVIEFW